MIRSMYTGMSGLAVHQTKMDTISNNIANANTIAYKSSRATFSDVLSQTMRGAAAASETSNRGVTNPMQVGLGASLSSIDKKMSQGAAMITNNPLDVMINGDGFFIVGHSEAEYLTRAGNFNLDAAGNLNMNGWKVFGWDTVLNNKTMEWEIDRTSDIYPINISGDKKIMEASPTTQVGIKGNLNIAKPDDVETSLNFYDSEGNRYTAPTIFKYDKERMIWSYDIVADSSGKRIAYMDGDTSRPIYLGFGATQGIDSKYTPLGYIGFDINGKPLVVTHTDNATSVQESDDTPIGTEVINNLLKTPANMPDKKVQAELFVSRLGSISPDNSVTFGNGGTGSIVLDFTDLTQFAGLSDAKTIPIDGNAEGELKNINIGTDGKITGSYTNGETKTLWQISLSDIDNPDGLEKVGDNLFRTTVQSGGRDGELWQTKVGNLKSGALEMSNTDISEEFTQMITTQRGFQANSRIITVSDEMIQTARDLKR